MFRHVSGRRIGNALTTRHNQWAAEQKADERKRTKGAKSAYNRFYHDLVVECNTFEGMGNKPPALSGPVRAACAQNLSIILGGLDRMITDFEKLPKTHRDKITLARQIMHQHFHPTPPVVPITDAAASSSAMAVQPAAAAVEESSSSMQGSSDEASHSSKSDDSDMDVSESEEGGESGGEGGAPTGPEQQPAAPLTLPAVATHHIELGLDAEPVGVVTNVTVPTNPIDQPANPVSDSTMTATL
jgi:hypothetical protein